MARITPSQAMATQMLQREQAPRHRDGKFMLAVADWCPHCLKTTLIRHDIYALVSDGPHRIGEYAVCEECAYSPYQEDTR